MVLTGLQRDISAHFGIRWQRRSLWNRNYSETRLPACLLYTSCSETVNDVVSARAGEIGFESFVECEAGVQAYIQQTLSLIHI